MTCELCEWAIVGKPLNNVYNGDTLVAKVCNYCYRGLYGFRYHVAYLRKAADMLEASIEKEGQVKFLERRRIP